MPEPQQPVQARSLAGLPLWHHGCGAIDDRAEQPGPFACSTLGCTAPWRPLLVGGDPAPEHPTAPEVTDAQYAEEFQLIAESEAAALASGVAVQRDRDLIAQVMAELGVDRPEDVLGALEQRFNALVKTRADREQAWKERDEARSEVERLRRDYVVGKTWREQREEYLAAQQQPVEPGTTARKRVGRSHGDIVYQQVGEHPSNDDPRVAVFMGPDAERLAARYVLLNNGATPEQSKPDA